MQYVFWELCIVYFFCSWDLVIIEKAVNNKIKGFGKTTDFCFYFPTLETRLLKVTVCKAVDIWMYVQHQASNHKLGKDKLVLDQIPPFALID